MYKYGLVIYWSDEDQAWIAEAPELPGCMAHGDTPAAALANVTEAVQLWVDTAVEFGDAVPEQKGGSVLRPAPEFRAKSQFERLSNRRRSNPHVTFSKGSHSRMNPKAQ